MLRQSITRLNGTATIVTRDYSPHLLQSGKEDAWTYSKCIGNAHELLERWILETALNLAEVPCIQSGLVREILLGRAPIFAKAANICTDDARPIH